MMEELLILHDGKHYLGHVRAAPGHPLMSSLPSFHWCFAHRGRLVAEFPATTLDTPETVKARLLGVLARIEGNVPRSA